MSYILDALRRADAQRSREQATASGQLLSNLDDPLQGASRRKRMPPGLMLSAVGLAVAAALGWQFWGSASSPSVPAAPVASVASPDANLSPSAASTVTSMGLPQPGIVGGTAAAAAAAAAVVAAPSRAPDLPPPLAGQAVGAPVTPADQIRPAAPPPAPAVAITDLPKVPGVDALPPVGSSRVGPASPVPTAATPPRPAGVAGNVGVLPPSAVPMVSPAPTPTPTPSLSPPAASSQPTSGAGLVTGWPADAPKLALSGGVYSANAAQRMVIVNGQVVREGAEAAPGVTVEQIRPQSAVLVRNGQRYLLPF